MNAAPSAADPGAVRALIEHGAGMAHPRQNPELHGTPYVALPAGWALHDLPTEVRPQHPKALAKLRDAASFARYVQDHAVARSRIYATLEPAQFLAVFDDFEPGADAVSVGAQADWREFRAQFVVPPSREWTLWTGGDRNPMAQLDFARHLEDNLPDIVEPDGAALLEMALRFEASSAGSFVAVQRLQDGSHDLQWRAENNTSGSVRLPPEIALMIPTFENEAPSMLRARLRYRVKDSALSIWYELIRPHKALEAAFRDAWARIANETGVPILLGSPE